MRTQQGLRTLTRILSWGCPGGTKEISRWQAERSHRTATTIPTSPGGAAELKYHRFPLCRIHAGMNPLDRILERPSPALTRICAFATCRPAKYVVVYK